jgi:hypothetical protein
MAQEKTYSGILGDLQRFQASMETKINEVPHLGPSRVLLQETLGRAENLFRRQSAATAEKQNLSQQLQAELVAGQRLATVLRKGLQHHFGPRSEDLAEFGLQPFRGRKANSKKKAAKPAEEESGSSAA